MQEISVESLKGEIMDREPFYIENLEKLEL